MGDQHLTALHLTSTHSPVDNKTACILLTFQLHVMLYLLISFFHNLTMYSVLVVSCSLNNDQLSMMVDEDCSLFTFWKADVATCIKVHILFSL